MVEALTQLTYESWIELTTDPIFIISALIVWLLPLLIYIIIGSISHAKSPSGQILSKPMIVHPNFWYAPAVWFFIQLSLFLLFIIFPIWLNWIPE